MSTYEQALNAQAAQNDQEARDRKSAEGWSAILNKYTLRDSEANYKAVRDWSDPVTLESFEEFLRSKPAGFPTLDAVSREWLIDDIIANSHGDQNTSRQLKIRLSTYSLGQLREKRRSISFKQDVHTLPAAKLYVKEAHRDTSWNGTGYPTLLPQTVPPGQIRAIPTGEFLRSIAKTELWLFKRYCKIYGVEQCNYWLNN
jgi:hypothetical protein